MEARSNSSVDRNVGITFSYNAILFQAPYTCPWDTKIHSAKSNPVLVHGAKYPPSRTSLGYQTKIHPAKSNAQSNAFTTPSIHQVESAWKIKP